MGQRVSRKNEHAEDVKQLTERVSDEYRLFYYNMMEKDKKEIFESCDKIRFYSCVSEYFEWNEDINKKAVKELEGTRHPLEELWMYYIGHEYISVSSWEDIDEMLSCYSDRLCKDIPSDGIPG